MLEKTVRVGELDVKFRSSAIIPRLYRIKFKRDIFKNLSKVEKTFKANDGVKYSKLAGQAEFDKF